MCLLLKAIPDVTNIDLKKLKSLLPIEYIHNQKFTDIHSKMFREQIIQLHND